MSSNSRESILSILIRFEDISTRILISARMTRREIQNKEDELPEAAEDPFILKSPAPLPIHLPLLQSLGDG